MKYPRLLIFCILSIMFGGCGSGGSGSGSSSNPPAQPTAILLHLKTDGILPSGDSIRGIAVTINLPPGVNVKNGTSGPDIAASGVAVGKTMASTPVIQENTASTNTTGGRLTFTLVWSDPIEKGEFATVNCGVSSGFFPNAGDFSLTDTNVTSSTTYSSITTLSVSKGDADLTY